MSKENKAASEQTKEKKESNDVENKSIDAEKPEQKESARQGSGAHSKIDFSTFIYSLFTTAQLQLGEIPNPYTQKYEEDLTLAAETIDIIILLRNKTAGNLTDDEEKLIEDLLYNLRMTYIRKSERKKQAPKE